MARITTNTTGTQPIIQIGLANAQTGTVSFTSNIQIPFIQDVTVTNSTGVYAYTTFSDTDMRKVSTPADNEVSMNVVIDDLAFYGNANAAAGMPQNIGLQSLASNKTFIAFRVYTAGNATIAGTASRYRQGTGFITSLAPTVSPEAPVWVTPMTIAVDGGYTDSSGTS